MYKMKTNTAVRVAAAAALCMGLAASAVSIASASTHSTHLSNHDSVCAKASSFEGTNCAHGVVTAVATDGSSVTVLSAQGTSTIFTITPTTTFTEGSATVPASALVVGDRVGITLSSTTPPTATSIKIEAAKALRVEGVVSAYVANTSISITTKHSTTPVLYNLTPATTITGLATGATAPAVNDNVDLVLSTTTPVTVVSIKIDGAKCDGSGAQGNHESNTHESSTSGTNHRGTNHRGSNHRGSNARGMSMSSGFRN
jgi:hypothetical protein